MIGDIDYLTAAELGKLAVRVVLAVGMTPGIVVTLPKPVEGVSWRSCYKRGIERLSQPPEML
jgi:hypothetical protein